MPKAEQQPDLALAAVLRKLREANDESQERLALSAGITAGALARIELGQAVPSWTTVRAIAAALDVTLTELAREVEAQERPRSRARPDR